MNKPKRLLLTGAAGEIGSVLRPALRGAADNLRWHDIRAIEGAAPDEEVMTGDLTAPGVADTAMAGVDCVIHLAGLPRETAGTPEQILTANVVGTHNMFEAARKAGVRRFIFASSNHVIGFYRADVPIGPDVLPRPDGHYGLSKVFGEGMGRLYADKHGMEVACLRIGAFRAKPGNARELGAWISHGDMAQLARRCVEAPPFHFLVLYGVSANKRARWGGDEKARAHIGYKPEDNAEAWATELEGKATPGGQIAATFHGGSLCALGFTGDPQRIT
jgi:uronate dehydrogenase